VAQRWSRSRRPAGTGRRRRRRGSRAGSCALPLFEGRVFRVPLTKACFRRRHFSRPHGGETLLIATKLVGKFDTPVLAPGSVGPRGLVFKTFVVDDPAVPHERHE